MERKDEFTDQDAKGSFMDSNNILVLKHHTSDPLVYRSAGMPRMKQLVFSQHSSLGRSLTPTGVGKAEDPRMIFTPASSSSSVPPLPEEVNGKTLIHFDALPANVIMKKLRRELDKLDCEYSSAKNKIEGKIIQGTELYQFCASLYTLDPKEGGKVRRLGLDMQLLQGERTPWFRFLARLTEVLEGKIDHDVREFVEGYFDLPDLESFSGQSVAPDREYLKSCTAMVESCFLENQVSGLKGIKEILDICSRGDILAMNLALPVIETITKALESKDLTVFRVASDLLSRVLILHQDDAKICDPLQAVFKKMDIFIAEQQKEGFELRYIKKKIRQCRSLLKLDES